ncbi:MAG: OmpA family protein [Candidatus Omnitrophota bacterium]|nr:OmpA family protein [Candidatus Omnitrophota bacterium]
MKSIKSIIVALIFLVGMVMNYVSVFAAGNEERRKQDIDALQQKFEWWPTDAKPAPVKDEGRGGYWWWPSSPGSSRPWGNRGYVYVHKIIFDYKEEELPPPKPQEMRASLLIKKILRNVKIYFDYDSASLRTDATAVLEKAVKTLKKNPDADILVTGNCDVRGPEAYNLKLGKRRSEAVKRFMLENGIPEERVRIVSRGKLDAVAPVSDLVGMQKERNAQFMIAEVEEVMIPYGGAATPETVSENVQKIEEGKYIEESKELVETPIKASTKEYTIKKGDTLWIIAERQLGKGYRWKYIYELNKETIKNPNKLKVGKKILIPVE